MKIRGFELVSEYLSENIELPQRKTHLSAGYDICAAKDTVLLNNKVTIVPTGLKAYMLDDEYLAVHIRSGLSIKNSLSLVNSQGIIDCDYYNNQDNEGHIMIAFLNSSDKDFVIKKGDRIAQGIFCKYLLTDDDSTTTKQLRLGGFGSTKGF